MLQVQGHFKDEEFYDIETKEINDFGKETEQKYHDCVNKLLPEYSTSINKKVTYLKMTMKKNKDAELTKYLCPIKQTLICIVISLYC